MALKITIELPLFDEDIAVLKALIATHHSDPIMPEIAARPIQPPSSPVSGVVSPPSISATVEVAPAEPDVSIPLPPAPSAPAVVVPPPPALNIAGAVLDKEGLPWDARIHGESRAQTAKGLWKRKRNTSDDEWNSVRAQLQQAMGAPPAPAPVVVPPPPEPSEAEVAFGAVPLPPAAIPPAPAPTAPPPPAATDAVDAFGALLLKVTGAQKEGKLTPADTAAACISVGLTAFRDLLHRQDLIPAVDAALFS